MDLPPGYSSDSAKSISEIRAKFPIGMTYEKFYGITDLSMGPPPGFEEEKKVVVATQPVIEPKHSQEKEQHTPTTKEAVSAPSPIKEKSEEDSWVTVKPKTRKKIPGNDAPLLKNNSSAPRFDSFAEIQLSSNKNKKKSLKKKLKEIKDLLLKQASGEKLNQQQLEKVQNKDKLEKELNYIT